MKKNLSLWMLGIAAMLASCSNEDVLQGTNDSGMKSVTVAVNLEGINPYTRVTPTMTETDAEVTRCYMEVLEDGTSKELVAMTGDQTNGYTSTLSLDPDKEYQFLFWADGGDNCYTIEDIAGQRLQSIKVKDGEAVSIAYQAVEDWEKTEIVSAELTHAVAKVSLKTKSDLKSGKTVALTIPSYSGYRVGGNTDEATDIFAGTTRTDHEYTATLSADITGDATNGAFVFSCYVLNNQNEEVKLQYSDNPSAIVYNVPLKANQHSTLLGDLANFGLTSISVTATINPDWDDAGTTDYPQSATVDATSHTINTSVGGQLTKELLNEATENGWTELTINGPLNSGDIAILKEWLTEKAADTPSTTADDETTESTKYTLNLNDIEAIPANAFNGCTNVSTIKMPNANKIGEGAFMNMAKPTLYLTYEGDWEVADCFDAITGYWSAYADNYRLYFKRSTREQMTTKGYLDGYETYWWGNAIILNRWINYVD